MRRVYACFDVHTRSVIPCERSLGGFCGLIWLILCLRVFFNVRVFSCGRIL